MASDTSLVFNLVARERVSGALNDMKEKFSAAGDAVAAALGVSLGAGIAGAMDVSAANAKLAAQLGLGSAEAAKVSQVSAKVFQQGWGDSAATVDEAIKGVYQQIGDTSTAQGGLEGVTSKVLALSETFDQDLGGVTTAVGQMIKTGLAKNADQAMDILTRGFQTGADKAGDLLDTMNEYGVQFKKFGLDGQMATGLLSQGLKGGARDADLVADAIKEFSIRSIDGSTTTAQGFKAIGLNAKDMAAQIGKGGKSASGALDLTLDRLRNIHDPVKRAAAATQLFGTQAEDLGNALYSLDPSSAVSSLGKVGGAANQAMATVGNSPSANLEMFKRQIQGKLTEVGGTIVGWANDHKGVLMPIAAALGVIAGTVLVVRGAMMAWTAIQTIWTAATTVATAVQWAYNAAMLANPMAWVVIAIVAVIAVIVLIATKTTWFQTAWKATWAAIQAAASWAMGGIRAAISWLAGLPGLIGGWVSGAYHAVVQWLSSAVSWVAGLPGRFVNALSSLGSKLWTAASNGFGRLKAAAIDKAIRLYLWVSGMPGTIASKLGDLGSLLYNKGMDVVRGLWNGISSMGGWIYNQLIGWARSMIPGPIAKALGIASPSKVTKAQGRWIARGLIDGLTGSSAQVRVAATKLADIVRDSMKPGRRKNAALAMIAHDTAQLVALANKQSSVAGRLKSAQKALADLQKNRSELVNSVRDSILQSGNITSGVDAGVGTTADQIFTTLRNKVDAARKFAKDLDTLRKKGVSKDLVAQIAQAGVDSGGATAAALATASGQQIKQINQQQAALQAAAQHAGTAAGDAMYASGIHAAEGLVRGLQKQEKAIEAQMLRIARAMSRAIKRALGIHSPSTLMADEVGQYIPPGLMAGVERRTPQLAADLQRWAASTVTPAVRAGALTTTGPAPVQAAAPMRAGAPTVRVVMDVTGADQDLKRLFRKIVRVDGRGSVQVAFGTS